MNLLFIYGPPAVGKYTVAKEISKKTGYKLFHNHLVVDLVTSLFEFDSKEANDLSNKLRIDLLSQAVKSNLEGVIFTVVYSKGIDDKITQEIVGLVEKNKGEVLFVRLYCTKEELEKRVGQKSRKKFNKVTDKSVLNDILNKYKLDEEIPNSKSLNIDNTNLTTNQTVEKIIAFYKL